MIDIRLSMFFLLTFPVNVVFYDEHEMLLEFKELSCVHHKLFDLILRVDWTHDCIPYD